MDDYRSVEILHTDGHRVECACIQWLTGKQGLVRGVGTRYTAVRPVSLEHLRTYLMMMWVEYASMSLLS